MSDSTLKARRRKAWKVAGYMIKRPHPRFPLSPHPSGKWQKRILGKLHYFGTWATRVNGKLVPVPDFGWKDAEDEYEVQASDLLAGRDPKAKNEDPNVAELCNEFLTAMLRRLNLSGDEITKLFALTKGESWTPHLAAKSGLKMSPRMAMEYRATTDRIVATFGRLTKVSSLRPSNFTLVMAELAKQYGPVRQGNEVQKIKTVFRWGHDNEVIATIPRYGNEFRKPGKDVLRRHRAEQGQRTFTANEVRRMIDMAGPQLKAMILLGINCGYGNTDVGRLPLTALELDGGWATFPRPKTGIERRAKLWADTTAALRVVLATRVEPAPESGASGFVFVTKFGGAWAKDGTNAVAHEFGKLLAQLDIIGHRGFYSLRHSFRSVADGSKDTPAIRLMMGHADGAIDDTYRHGIDDSRLVAVAELVREWLFPKKTPRKNRVKSK
jgi:integrase